jgi:hypothetical protein
MIFLPEGRGWEGDYTSELRKPTNLFVTNACSGAKTNIKPNKQQNQKGGISH